MWQTYFNAASLDEVLNILAEKKERARIVSGGTDLVLELERGQRKNIETLVDITRIPGLDAITLSDDGKIRLGAQVTHNDCVGSALIRERAFPLAQATWGVGAPQIRNRGTVAGNLITASPANDTITPLMALGAAVALRSRDGERTVPLEAFYTGVRRTVMRPDEMLVEISFPAMTANQRGTFLKLGLRQAQAISVVNVAIVLTFEGERVSDAAITLGAVAPTIIHARAAEDYLQGRTLTEETLTETARLAMEAATPIDDIRGSAAYRREMVRVLTARGLRALLHGEEQTGFPDQPPLLRKPDSAEDAQIPESSVHPSEPEIVTTINGREYRISGAAEKTLLAMLRDDLGLMGTKEGCGEGECGACTVWLDGEAVMSCLVPAPRAHGAQIVTVEGLGNVEQLHPVQDAFVHEGAVQCGYCTPGFLMSSAILLEEIPTPSREQIKQAITGNLCRCTGYYKIVDAIEQASKAGENPAVPGK